MPQCKRCQEYGHTHNFCHKTPRCVKCDKQYFSRDCSKPQQEDPKCVHCGEKHPANYRGCEVYKELLKFRNTADKKQPTRQTHQRKNKTNTSQPNTVPEQPASIDKPTTTKAARQTYSQTTIGKQQNPIAAMLQQIIQRHDKLEAKYH